MTNSCPEWTERLMDAALSNEVHAALGDHLKRCERCAAALTALRRRREQMDSLLPLLVRGAEPSLGFRARVLAATEYSLPRRRPWLARAGALAAATAVIVAVIVLGSVWRFHVNKNKSNAILYASVAEWRSPTEALLRSGSSEILRSSPRLGELYFPLAAASPGKQLKKVERRHP